MSRQTSMKEPRPPFPEQEQEKPGLESELRPRPRYRARAYRGADKLKDKVALITGGDSGIGRAVAVLYAREGADVAIVYLPVEQSDAEETRAAVEGEGRRCELIPGDVTDADFCRRAVAQTVDALGRLDVLVNNAAFQNHIDSIDDLARAVGDHPPHQHLATSHGEGRPCPPGAAARSSTLARSPGSRARKRRSISPAAIHPHQEPRPARARCPSTASRPARWDPAQPADREAKEVAHFGEEQPMGRPAQPEEIAPAFVYFASQADSSYVTGEVLTLLGGETRAA
jgi:NAD(P)-dependent dehydrogenase (short-subunit alcohol dehydrogenase family)